jgi:hypothetical protein
VDHALPWIALLAGGALIWALRQLRVVASVGAAYRAKILCTAIFASRRQMELQAADEIAADSYWILRPFRARLDLESHSVTASFFGLVPRTAVYRAGSGATLRSQDFPFIPSRFDASVAAPPRTIPWTRGLNSTAVQAVVDEAFSEPDPKRLRRTHAVVVIQDGQIIAERYDRGVDADTPLPGWSMTKSVLGTLVGMLVADGRLTLDQRELLPAWALPDPCGAITLEDLLRMRSGLRFSENYANPWSDVLHMLFNCGDAGGYAAGRPLAATPGSTWAYSSGTTNILSLIARRAVGESAYGGWPRLALFEPLGMQSAILEPDASGTFVCSSFMVATARDWARFGQLWMGAGRWHGRELLPASWVRFSTTPTPQSPGGRYGAHWWLKLNPEIGGDSPAARAIAPDAFFAIGHEGQTLTIIPSKRLVAVRMGASIFIDAWNQAAFVAALQQAL